jgi:hypothetical protein
MTKDTSPPPDGSNYSLSPVASLSCTEEVACRISAYFETLLRSSQRRTQLFPSCARRSIQHNHNHLKDVAWRYTRIAELWKSRTHHDNTWQSTVFQDSFGEQLMRICLALAEWVDVRRSCYVPMQFVDETYTITALERKIESLEQGWMTWSLCVEIHKQAMRCRV